MIVCRGITLHRLALTLHNKKVIRHRHIGGLLMRALIILVPILFSQISIVFAQNPYIREGSIGKQKEQTETSPKDPLSFRPIEKWVGEKFIFLPKSKSSKEYGYLHFNVGGWKGRFDHPNYEECVGRIGTITKVSDSFFEKITIQMDDNGQIYTGQGNDSIGDIAPVADIDYARNKWLGKILWYAREEISTYNETTGEFGSIRLKIYSPVKVVDVVAGWSAHTPVRFILQTPSGEEGFIDVNLSGTNVSYILIDCNRFEEFFFTEDPKKIYKWSSKVWTAIEGKKVFVGMTAEQARMSWGKPEEINKTITGNGKNEQWVYGSGSYLYFDNGVLTGIQN